MSSLLGALEEQAKRLAQNTESVLRLDEKINTIPPVMTEVVQSSAGLKTALIGAETRWERLQDAISALDGAVSGNAKSVEALTPAVRTSVEHSAELAKEIDALAASVVQNSEQVACNTGTIGKASEFLKSIDRNGQKYIEVSAIAIERVDAASGSVHDLDQTLRATRTNLEPNWVRLEEFVGRIAESQRQTLDGLARMICEIHQTSVDAKRSAADANGRAQIAQRTAENAGKQAESASALVGALERKVWWLPQWLGRRNR